MITFGLLVIGLIGMIAHTMLIGTAMLIGGTIGVIEAMNGREDFDNEIESVDIEYEEIDDYEYGFSDEEILAMGLYPNDEGYQMSLISRILNK